MKGADAILGTLLRCGVDVCFANPGTAEMHFVAALDSNPRMRGVLTLFEGVATGAADGYARMAGRPAATLLHLGPGLGNGVANLHNARRAHTPVVNLVGDHATFHKRFDAPLTSDIEALAGNVSGWLRTSRHLDGVGQDVAEAVAAAASGHRGQVATLIVPADLSWSEGASLGHPIEAAPPAPAPEEAVEAAAKALAHGATTALLAGGRALTASALRLVAGIAQATGARLFSETFPARIERGGDLPNPERLAYVGARVEAQLAGVTRMVLVDAATPVASFAYPGERSELLPDGTEVVELVGAGSGLEPLDALAERVGAGRPAVAPAPGRPEVPDGPLDAAAFTAVVGALLPEGAIVVDESITSGAGLDAATLGAPRHDWLAVTGGAIGQGIPASTGAALAAPDRKVVSLEADGSAMYTLQGLWTQAREGLDVTTVILNNRAYSILQYELRRVGAASSGQRSRSMLQLTPPDLDFVAMSQGLGVEAVRVRDVASFADAFGSSLRRRGPFLIEVELA